MRSSWCSNASGGRTRAIASRGTAPSAAPSCTRASSRSPTIARTRCRAPTRSSTARSRIARAPVAATSPRDRPLKLEKSALLAQRLLRIEALALAGLGGQLAAHALHDVEEVPVVLHGGRGLALAEVDVLDVHVVAGADLLGPFQVLEFPPLQRLRDLLGVDRLHLTRRVEEHAHCRVGRRRVAAGRALPESEVTVVVRLGGRVLVLE